jgi:hypothetical protein
MKHLVLAFALSTAVAACLAQDTKTETSDLDQAYACLTTADCPPNTVCGADSECHAPSTTTLPPHSCSSTLQCPAHERCNPVCSTTGTVGHVCQPEGLPTHVCPDPLP